MAQIKDLKRMCEYYSDCEDCPLYINCTRPDSFSGSTDEIVDDWVKDHPVKTYAMDFFEKFPNAPKSKDGEPKTCIQQIYSDVVVSIDECRRRSCAKCWNQEIKEKLNLTN